jgi:hypothetical protein
VRILCGDLGLANAAEPVKYARRSADAWRDVAQLRPQRLDLIFPAREVRVPVGDPGLSSAPLPTRSGALVEVLG